MSDKILRIEVADALVLKPGERVLLILDHETYWSPADVGEAQERLRERFPGVEFTITSGVDRVAVERAQ